MVRKDRAGSRIGGDFAIICRNDWKVKALNVTDSLEFESFVIRNRASLSFRLRLVLINTAANRVARCDRNLSNVEII